MNKDLFSLKKKVIVITGAAGLLGRQHADAVATFGGIPVLLDLNVESIEQMAKELNRQYDVNAVGYAVDITNEENIKENCRNILDRYGKIDGLVNNATNNPKMENNDIKNFSRLENFPIENWNADVYVGLTGAFICAKHYGTAISKNPEGGVIINISSDLGLIAPDQRLYEQSDLPKDQQPVKPVTYSVIKTGLIGLTRYLATYWPSRVRCNALCPGGVDTGLPKDFVKKVENLVPMNRMAFFDEYQGVLIFMLSDASKYMNGAVIPMDGGRTTY